MGAKSEAWFKVLILIFLCVFVGMYNRHIIALEKAAKNGRFVSGYQGGIIDTRSGAEFVEGGVLEDSVNMVLFSKPIIKE